GRTVAPDAIRLESVERRLAELARLQKKYGGTVDDLVAKREALARDLALAAEGEEGLGALGAAAEHAEQEARGCAERLGAPRRRAGSPLPRTPEGRLRPLPPHDAPPPRPVAPPRPPPPPPPH